MIRVGTRENQTAFAPGETLEGAALWELPSAPRHAEVRLLWFTRGKGTGDSEVVANEIFSAPLPGDTRTFRFVLPHSPYSFSGKLISLLWALELVVGEETQRLELVIAPQKTEVLLPNIPQPKFMGIQLTR